MPRLMLIAVVFCLSVSWLPAATPNVVLVYADDMGYGDLGCYGETRWQTPHLDRLAKDGIRFTDFYVAQAVCSASRTALLTGCYSNRLGIHGALGPGARHGINSKETTLAEVFKSKGYATAVVGKWHLGHHQAFLPKQHGFDTYFGLPYSNDMWPHHPEAKKGTYPPLPLFADNSILNPDVSPTDQEMLTRQYIDKAVNFVRENKDRPFFLYVPHTFPHVPLFVGEKFRGSSKFGLYGDVIQELDGMVGEILQELDRHGLSNNTLVLFASDNGPWLSYGNHSGTAGPLREGKGTSFEGGVRVPFIARWPGVIPAGSECREPAMTIDLLPTLAKIIGADLPKLRIDGKDIGPLLRAEPGAKSPQKAYWFYFAQGELQAIRSGKWKLMLPHTTRTMQGQEPGRDGKPGKYRPLKVEQWLFDLSTDVGETKDLSAEHPEVVSQLLSYAEEAREELGDSLTKRKGKGVREPGRVP